MLLSQFHECFSHTFAVFMSYYLYYFHSFMFLKGIVSSNNKYANKNKKYCTLQLLRPTQKRYDKEMVRSTTDSSQEREVTIVFSNQERLSSGTSKNHSYQASKMAKRIFVKRLPIFNQFPHIFSQGEFIFVTYLVTHFEVAIAKGLTHVIKTVFALPLPVVD